MKKQRVAVSTSMATIFLVAIVLVGGIFAYAYFTGLSGNMVSSSAVIIEGGDLGSGLEGGSPYIQLNVKNGGQKPIIRISLQVSGENPVVYDFSDNPIEPGKSYGIIQPLSSDYFVGSTYTYTVTVYLSDGSSYTKTGSFTASSKGYYGGSVDDGETAQPPFRLLNAILTKVDDDVYFQAEISSNIFIADMEINVGGMSVSIPDNALPIANGESKIISAVLASAASWFQGGSSYDISVTATSADGKVYSRSSSVECLSQTQSQTVKLTVRLLYGGSGRENIEVYVDGKSYLTNSNGEVSVQVAPNRIHSLSVTPFNVGSETAVGITEWGDGSRSNPRFVYVGETSLTLTGVLGELYWVRVYADLGGYASANRTGWVPAGESITCTAYPQNLYVFKHWTVNDAQATSNPVAITVNAPTTVIAYFRYAPVSVMFSASGVSSDGGVVLTVDGVGYSANTLPQSFTWTEGSIHTYSWSQTVQVDSGKRYVWKSASGLVTQSSGTFTVSASGSVTALYDTQYYLATVAQPSGAGSLNPSGGWYNSGAEVSVSVSPASGYNFERWLLNGAEAGTAVPLTLTMNKAYTVTAVFTSQPVPFNFAVQLSRSSCSVQQGKSVSVGVTVKLIAGASEQVILSAEAPEGVTATFTPVSGMPQFSSTLTLTVSDAVQAGTYMVTVKGVSGGIERSASLSLTVNPSCTFSLSLSEASMTLQQDETATINVALQRLSGSAAITLSASGAPQGVSISFNPATGTPSFTSVMSIAVSKTAPPGVYNVVVSAVGGGSSETVTFQLTVTALPFDFEMQLSKTSATIEQGDQASATLTLTFTQGQASPVQLSVLNVPNGLSVSFSPSTLTPTASSIMSLSASSMMQTGVYTFTVKAEGGGVTRTCDFTLTVNVKPFSYSLTASSTSISVQQGKSVSTILSVTLLQGQPESVSLILENVPSDVTAAFNATSGTPTFKCELTFTASSTAAITSHNIIVKALSAGGLERTLTLTVNVHPSFTFTVSSSTTNIVVKPGSSASALITVSPSSGTPQPTQLTVTGAPLDATVSLSTMEQTPPFTSTLTIITSSSTPIGTYTITVKAECAGVAYTVNIQFVVSNIMRVQGPVGASASSNVVTVTLPTQPKQGNVLVAAIYYDQVVYNVNLKVASIEQSGVSWLFITKASYLTYSLYSEIWVGHVGAGASQTLTVTLNDTAYLHVYLAEYEGVSSVAPVDIVNAQALQSTGNWVNAVDFTVPATSSANEVLICAVMAHGGQSGVNNPIGTSTAGWGCTSTQISGSVSPGYFELNATSVRPASTLRIYCPTQWAWSVFSGSMISLRAADSAQTYQVTFIVNKPADTTVNIVVSGVAYAVSANSLTLNLPAGNHLWNALTSTEGNTRYAPTVASGTINVPTVTQQTITYNRQYLVSFAVSPSGAGSTTPSGSQWYNEGTQVQVSASPASYYQFREWVGSGQGSYSGVSNPATITVNSPITETANFDLVYSNVTFAVTGVSSDASSIILMVDGVGYSYGQLPKIFTWQNGSTHTFEWADPVAAGANKRYVWSSTSGLSTQRSGSITVPNAASSVSAVYNTQYSVTVNNVEHCTLSFSGMQWFFVGDTFTVTATADQNYVVEGFNVNGEYIPDNPLQLTITTSYTVAPIVSAIDNGNPSPLSGWHYRRSFTVSSTVPLSNGIVKLTVYYGGGVD
ncbi:MAG: hypothetical protein NWF09_08855, partial [Candidatus Bathyarchaeota archaeon]|nr:hypothetical protein [Candidatus Bathyarchaeota archaeon]